MNNIKEEIKKIDKNNNLKIDLYIFGGINILLLVMIFDYFNFVNIFKYVSLIITSIIYERYSLMFGTFWGNRKKKLKLLEELNKSENKKNDKVDEDCIKLKELNYVNSVNLCKDKKLKLTKRK